jgi:hypothetical protein
MKLLINQEFRATNAYAVENIHDVRKELDEVYGAGQAKVTEMTRATVIRLTTAAACLAVVEHTHTGVKETANAGLIPVIGSGVRNLYDGALLNLIWTENPELDTDHWLDIRIWTMNSCWHLSSVLFTGF